MFKGKDRRQYKRHTAGELSVSIKHKNLADEYGQKEKVIPMDFNRYGMSFNSVSEFEIGDMLMLEIRKHKEHLTGIIAIVSNVREMEHENRYGIQFDFSANDYMLSEEVEEILGTMERSLKKSYSSLNRSAYRRIKQK